MVDKGSNRLLVLGGLLFMVFSGVIGVLVILAPSPSVVSKAEPTEPAPISSVFGDSRSSAQLQAEISGQLLRGNERGSGIDKLQSGQAVDSRLKAAEERLARARARLAKAEKGGSTWSVVKKAENLYFKYKNSEQFKNSPGIRKWKREFLSYPDLAKINDDYYNKDGSTINFIRNSLASPNFGKVVSANINRPDVRSFFNSMAGNPGVMRAAKVMMNEHGLKAAIEKLSLPGIGSIGRMRKAGEEFRSGKKEITGENAMELMGMDPSMLDPDKAVQKALKSAPPADSRRGR
jgi:hypothetical protein